ncbi:MAG: HpcH/HpaI aldolase/citrate lyase family protein [Actinomycetota bacterium]|nr:HpcH/HpaI aldolase/citrate lyase family protein [Actinomycetota bacterium]
MRHFDFLSDSERQRLFLHEPGRFDAGSDPGILAVALGATLYSPATRTTFAADAARRAAQGVTSMVACLEDSVADAQVAAAERNLVVQLGRCAQSESRLPLLFVRVRTAAQISMIVSELGRAGEVLSGFVLPKFTDESGPEFLDAIVVASEGRSRPLMAMPVLESHEMMYVESRIAALCAARALVDKYREHILAVRVGATDLSAAYGIRRSRDLTIYDVRMVADVIADVVNVFGRGERGFVVTGPVWEYFSSTERIFKPQLRESPFLEHAGRGLRSQLIEADVDGLIREIALDRANGLTGKTVIHPSHVAVVHALSVVSNEEYADAADIIAAGRAGGAAASPFRNKMNEAKPHTSWAQRTMLRAQLFGVSREGVSFVDVLGASLS